MKLVHELLQQSLRVFAEMTFQYDGSPAPPEDGRSAPLQSATREATWIHLRNNRGRNNDLTLGIFLDGTDRLDGTKQLITRRSGASDCSSLASKKQTIKTGEKPQSLIQHTALIPVIYISKALG